MIYVSSEHYFISSSEEDSLCDNGEIHNDKLAVERFHHMQLLPQRMRVIEQRWA